MLRPGPLFQLHAGDWHLSPLLRARPLQSVKHPCRAWVQSSWLRDGIVTEGANDLWVYFKDCLLD